jgi:hypothetical protein
MAHVWAQYGSLRSSFVVSDRERGQLTSDEPTDSLRSNDSGGAAFYSFTVQEWIHEMRRCGATVGVRRCGATLGTLHTIIYIYIYIYIYNK